LKEENTGGHDSEVWIPGHSVGAALFSVLHGRQDQTRIAVRRI